MEHRTLKREPPPQQQQQLQPQQPSAESMRSLHALVASIDSNFAAPPAASTAAATAKRLRNEATTSTHVGTRTAAAAAAAAAATATAVGTHSPGDDFGVLLPPPARIVPHTGFGLLRSQVRVCVGRPSRLLATTAAGSVATRRVAAVSRVCKTFATPPFIEVARSSAGHNRQKTSRRYTS